jgi:hypothetical protein
MSDAKKAEEMKKLVGSYRIKDSATLRAGMELDSEKLPTLHEGNIVACIEAKENSEGKVRMHLDGKGWISYKPHLMIRVDAEGNHIDGDGNPIVKNQPKISPMPKFNATRRRHSVSVSGVTGVTGELSHFQGLTGPGEQVFSVTQKHIKRAKTDIHLKVGGMGVTLFDGPNMLESYLYFDIAGWTYGKEEDNFVLQIKSGNKKIKFGTQPGDKDKIAKAMNTHAMGLAKATRKQAKESKETPASIDENQEEEEESDSDEEDEIPPEAGSPDVLGFYETLNPILVRTAPALDSAQAEPSMLDKGQVIEIVESKGLETGEIRLGFAGGWITLKPHLVEKCKNYQPEATPEEQAVETLKSCLKLYKDIALTGETAELQQQLMSVWAETFNESAAGESGADNSALRAKVEKLQSMLGSQQAAFADEESALEPKVSDAMVAAKAANAEKEAAQQAAAAVQAELDAFRLSSGEEIARLKAEAADLKAGLESKAALAAPAANGSPTAPAAPAEPPAAASVLLRASSLPDDAEELFATARAADASGDKSTALKQFQVRKTPSWLTSWANFSPV